MRIGHWFPEKGRIVFRLWAPFAERIDLHVLSPDEAYIPMKKEDIVIQGFADAEDRGYWSAEVKISGGPLRYLYRIDGGEEYPDPASYYQPEGVHGPSETVHHDAFAWTDDAYSAPSRKDLVFYEIHAGTFSSSGDFAGIEEKLDYLADLGITALEIMPVAQFPGRRNWGYDGTYPFAVQNSYGGPDGLKKLVNSAHGKGLAVFLDAVYNHLGPEGNYQEQFGPYFTDRYRTPWGKAVNYDGPYSDEVRNYYCENIRYWLKNFHMDGLRLDAVHAVYDFGARHIFSEFSESARRCGEKDGRRRYIIAESDLNDSRIVRGPSDCGYGFDAQWSDDFHHAVHSRLSGEEGEYYRDFGATADIAAALEHNYVLSGSYSRHRRRRHGNSASDIGSDHFVFCIQNHDQVGNRMLGERLHHLVDFESAKCAAAALLLSPALPLLFMGEEFASASPFQYFIHHGDEALIEATREGRKREFSDFHQEGEVPDPQSPEVFKRSLLRWEERKEGRHRIMLNLYKTLLRIRGDLQFVPPQSAAGKDVRRTGDVVIVTYRQAAECAVLLFNFGDESAELSRKEIFRDLIREEWEIVFDSSDAKWDGPGRPITIKAHEPQERHLSVDDLTLSLNRKSARLYLRRLAPEEMQEYR